MSDALNSKGGKIPDKKDDSKDSLPMAHDYPLIIGAVIVVIIAIAVFFKFKDKIFKKKLEKK